MNTWKQQNCPSIRNITRQATRRLSRTPAPTDLAHFKSCHACVTHKTGLIHKVTSQSFSHRSRDGDNLTFIGYQAGNWMNDGRFTPGLRSVKRTELSASRQDAALGCQGAGRRSWTAVSAGEHDVADIKKNKQKQNKKKNDSGVNLVILWWGLDNFCGVLCVCVLENMALWEQEHVHNQQSEDISVGSLYL